MDKELFLRTMRNISALENISQSVNDILIKEKSLLTHLITTNEGKKCSIFIDLPDGKRKWVEAIIYNQGLNPDSMACDQIIMFEILKSDAKLYHLPTIMTIPFDKIIDISIPPNKNKEEKK